MIESPRFLSILTFTERSLAVLNKKLKVYLDDERPTPEGWVGVRWPQDAVELLKTGNVSDVSLDHDLGDDSRGTGYDVIKWIENEIHTNDDFKMPTVHLHTMNPIARERMTKALRNIYRYLWRDTSDPDFADCLVFTPSYGEVGYVGDIDELLKYPCNCETCKGS